MNQNNSSKSGMIGFLMQPCKEGYSPQMAHIQLNEQCRFTQETLDTIKSIKESCKNAHKKIGVVTDADQKQIKFKQNSMILLKNLIHLILLLK